MNRIAVSACVALGTAGTLAAVMSGARAGEKASTIFTERDLVVTLVTPTINQEVTDTLSDPGLEGQITVRFSSMLNPRDVIDDQNVVNKLSPKVEFLDSKFARLPGTPQVRRNVFIFNPFSVAQQVLPPGQYTLNLKSSIRNTRGSLLNRGLEDYTATFSVGTDVNSPVLRRIAPINGQTGIGLLQPVVATFNEPLDAATILTTVTVQDASTNPPTNIPGVGGGPGITLARHGFDLVFTPDPCFGYPPKTNIQFLIKGQGKSTTPAAPVVASALSDVSRTSSSRTPACSGRSTVRRRTSTTRPTATSTTSPASSA
jgi:predicted component of type VI protein secretion system